MDLAEESGERDGDGSAPLRELSASEANNLFTALRKAANHVLLLRIRYAAPALLDRIALIAYQREHFGTQCDMKMVVDELQTFSDFDLNQLCAQFETQLGDSTYSSCYCTIPNRLIGCVW